MSESAVRKAILYGRITPQPDGSIDPERADREWDERTDPTQQRGAGAKSFASPEAARAARLGALERRADALEVQLAASGGAQGVETIATAEPRPALRSGQAAESRGEPETMRSQGGATILQLRQAELAVKVQKERLKYRKAAEELVSRAEAARLFFELFRRERDAWISWPARVAANLAAELGVDAHGLENALDRYVRDHLAEMATPVLDLSASRAQRGAA